MIQSRPKLNGKGLIFKALAFLILAVAMLMFAPLFGKYAAISQLLGFIFATYSLYIIVKYVVTDYLYTLEDGHFTVHKVTKSQSVCVADVELEDFVAVFRNDSKKSDNYNAIKTYTFIKNPANKNLSTIVFRLSDENYALVFEPDDIFYNALENELSIIKNNEDED